MNILYNYLFFTYIFFFTNKEIIAQFSWSNSTFIIKNKTEDSAFIIKNKTENKTEDSDFIIKNKTENKTEDSDFIMFGYPSERQIKADTINTGKNSIIIGGVRYGNSFNCGLCGGIKQLKIMGKYKDFLIFTRKIELTIDSNGRIIISGDLNLYDYSLSIEK